MLPHLALCPAAVWIATTMDAFFAGVGAWGTALLVLGARSRAGRVVLGLGAGLALGALPYLSYGMVPFLLVPLVAALVVGVPRSTVAACLAGMAAVSALFAAGGSGGRPVCSPPTPSGRPIPAQNGPTCTSWSPTWPCSPW